MTVTRRQAVVVVVIAVVAVALVFLAAVLESYVPLFIVWPVLFCVPLYVGATDRKAAPAASPRRRPAGTPTSASRPGSDPD